MDSTTFKAQNKAAAEATKRFLASGKDFGTSRKQFENSDVRYNSLEEVLNKYAALFIKGFTDEINKERQRGGLKTYLSDANGSGALIDSFRFEYKKLNKVYEVAIFMSDYAKFVDEGVQGVNKSLSVNQTSPYKFKFINPTEGHVAALEKWIKEKNIIALITKPKGIKSELKPKSLAFIIGRSTKKRGLRGVYFKKTVQEKLIEDFKAEIALAIDVDFKVNILLE